ncbi:hypothetical protein LLG96_15245 [bacterium]|nr:hypothetical protein [bacterium]
MKRVFCKVLQCCLFSVIMFLYSSCPYAQEEGGDFSLIFGWKTEGAEQLLAKEATALKKFKENRGLALSFGSMLGSTRIVDYDRGDLFLVAAKQAGFDYIIPSVSSFMFGVENFRRMAVNPDYPHFISANLVDEKTHRPIVDPYAMWYVSGLRICIIGMSDLDIIKKSPDANVVGLDVIPYDEALTNVSLAVARENADIVIVAGRLDRAAITEMVMRQAYVDMYITNNQSGGFSDQYGSTSMVYIGGKQVYIGSEAGDHLSLLTYSRKNDMESREFRDIKIGDAFPPDGEIITRLSEVLKKLNKKDIEESVITKTGGEVAKILKDVFDVDVVLLERQSLYYYPIADSLTLYDVRKVIKPYEKVTKYSLRGSYLKSVREQSNSQTDSELRLLYGGITADGKVDSIPVQDDTEYSILTTTHLRTGGNGYRQFLQGTGEILSDVNMLNVVENHLIEKEERIRNAIKPKVWELNLNITIASNYTRKDIDVDKAKYGDDIPKSWRDYADFYQGNFIISSMNDKLTMNKTVGRHIFNSYLVTSWSRTGSQTNTQNGIVYGQRKNNDPVELYSKYTYNLSDFPVKPYFDIKLNSFLYSGTGKHPIAGAASSGMTRSFPSLLNINVSLGLNGSRDFTLNKNTFGIENKFFINKEFPTNVVFKTPVKLESRTFINWNPLPDYYMAFQHESSNMIRFKIFEKVSFDIDVKSFSYRSTKQRKVALGFYYLLALSYGMNWKF